jgi:phosphotransacetylase (EC 2.3.1.8)
MSIMTGIWEKAKSSKKRIALPEGSEERTLRAAEIVKEKGYAEPVLVGIEDIIKSAAKKINVNIDGIEIINPVKSEWFDSFVEKFYELRKNKGVTPESAKETMKDEIYFATMLVKEKKVDGMVSGAIHSTGDLLRPALQIVKTAPGISIVSSSFVMEVPGTHFGENGLFVFADCAVNPDPDANELASIALSTAETARKLCGVEPRVAMLSFSTKGSGKHPYIDKVVEATKIVKEKNPALKVDGELQLDSAIVPKVAALKAPDSDVAGKANVLIFPDLQSGNIGYKLVQRLANAETIGPVSQGFAAPINDLSRGSSVDDIVNVIAITAVQAME